jgi:DNA-directed RNA polymerase subunit RPC12/RpoP
MSTSCKTPKANLRSEYGMACPKCGWAETLTIDIRCSANLSIHGTEPRGDHEWDETSSCFCDDCGHNGLMAEFCVADEAEVQS